MRQEKIHKKSFVLMKNAMAFWLCLKPLKAKLLSQTPSAIPVAKHIAQNAGFRSMKETATLIN